MTARSWFSIRASAAGADLHIYDAIGEDGIGADAFVRALAAYAQARELTIRINSPGGSCFDGVAIFNALARHGARKTVVVDGVAASAASVIAMAGDEIVMPENALMMVHSPHGAAKGNAAEMRKMAEALDRANASLVRIYVKRTKKSEGRITRMLDAETWMDADEAKRLGFCDRVEPAVAIAAQFDLARFGYKRAPQPSAAAQWSRVIAGRFAGARP